MKQQISSALATPVGQKVMKWGALGIGAIASFYVVRSIVRKIKANAESNNRDSNMQAQLNKLRNSINTAYLTIDETKATSLAEQLYSAMAGTGTNVGFIKQVVRNDIWSQADWDLVTVCFGARTYSDLFSDLGQKTLGAWFVEELSNSDYNDLRQLLDNKNAKIKL